MVKTSWYKKVAFLKKFFKKATLLILGGAIAVQACSGGESEDDFVYTTQDDLKLDPVTGVPYIYVVQFPINGIDASDIGFRFGNRNDYICIEYSNGQCTAYGYHVGDDTLVKITPVGTVIVSPADGIVRLSTDVKYGGFGAGSSANPDYKGCLLVLEHEFPNGQPVTTLLGHIKCESGVAYNPDTETGNPSVGTIVKRGQYLGHINHYWAGATQTTDWHHLHWGMRRGKFVATNPGTYIKGYVKKSEFTADPATGFMTHPDWIDPLLIVATNGDPAIAASADVKHHPSGTLLEDGSGMYWLVKNETEITAMATDVLSKDRYDLSHAVRASAEEMACYSVGSSVAALGNVTLYQRPGSTAVAVAYAATGKRYDFIRWEAMLSWGFEDSDLTHDSSTIQFLEANYAPAGYRLLRPGTLVKADEESEVSVVTYDQTRLPIASAEVFEALGYSWERIVSVPKSVITQVAGPRESSKLADLNYIHNCAMPPSCENGGSCGGGSVPEEPDAGAPTGDAGTPTGVEVCNGQDDNSNGQVDEIFLCKFGSLGNVCITSCNTGGYYLCTAPACNWGTCLPLAEDCDSGIDEDCNGLVDCADPACKSTSTCSDKSMTTLHLVYGGPVIPGVFRLFAWWQPPNALPRSWGEVTECVDTAPGDGWLDCQFAVPSGTSPLEFQIFLPDGRYWGDESCSPQGGCGKTIGNLYLLSQNGLLPVHMVSHSTNNEPYYLGQVTVP